MTVAEALAQAAATLQDAGIDDPRREARLLLSHATGLDPAAQLRHGAEPCGEIGTLQAFHALVARRAAREPMAFIRGTQGFWSIDLAVSPDTLIPRADSETLIQAALARFPQRADVGRILDLGTGTGCLLLAALTEFPAAWGLGVDITPSAAALARRNAQVLGLDGRAAFACGDWATAIGGRFDLVLCNPPYIASSEVGGLMPEVAQYESARALDGGPDGLDAYRSVTAALPNLLTARGAAVLELGIGQADAVAALAYGVAMQPLPVYFDIAGVARALVVVKHSPGARPAVA